MSTLKFEAFYIQVQVRILHEILISFSLFISCIIFIVEIQSNLESVVRGLLQETEIRQAKLILLKQLAVNTFTFLIFKIPILLLTI